jgi:hypothetical protein
MRLLYWMMVICMYLSLAACNTTSKPINTTPTPTKTTIKKVTPKNPTLSAVKQRKNPMTVTIFTAGEKPQKPYVVVGKETVSKFNFVGVKRQEAHIREAMRKLAANLGGDAIINVTHDDHSVSGTIIEFKA